MNAEELYELHQVLSALGGVLLHDLRNPLHSATLLVEAMGLRANDLDVLRGRLRAQLAKLDALISEAAGPMRELAIEPRIGPVDIRDLLSDVLELARLRAEDLSREVEVQASSEPVLVLVDRKMMARAIIEVVERLGNEVPPVESPSLPAARPVVVRLAREAPTVLLSIEGYEGAFPDSLAKAPFSIAGGGIGLALARALAQLSGATLRLQDGAGPRPRFVFGLPEAPQPS